MMFMLGVVIHTCNCITWEVEDRRLWFENCLGKKFGGPYFNNKGCARWHTTIIPPTKEAKLGCPVMNVRPHPQDN
jgi:hypothetical protein